MGVCILPNKKKKNKEIDTSPVSSGIIKSNLTIKEESKEKIIKKSPHNLDNHSIKSNTTKNSRNIAQKQYKSKESKNENNSLENFFRDYAEDISQNLENDSIDISQNLENDSPKLETNKKPLNKNMKNSISILENTNIEPKVKVISRNSSQKKNKLNESKKEDCKIEEMNKNSQNNLENDFKKKYQCSYTYEQIIINLAHFIEINENDIQESFYSINTEDAIFELLKKNEKQILVNFLNSKKNILINDVQNKLNNFNNYINYDFSELIKNIINIENGKQIYKQKIFRETSKINNDKDCFRIDVLTIMVVGQSGVGKSTLINKFLELEGNEKAPTGTGKYITTEISDYRSNKIPYLRLIDTRGIELNVNYGAEAIKNDATNYIRDQLNTNDINNFVSCIWYCITGNRFQQVEIDLLNALRSSYGDNTIPIIVVYTQAVDKKAITEMEQYIKDKNINATFITVLADRKELVNNYYVESYGLDILLKETLIKCKKAIKGDMRSVMVNNISNYIKDLLIKENSYIREYINEITILNFINKKYTILNEANFEEYIINIYGNNIKYFFGKEKENINKQSFNCFQNSELIKNDYNNYKSFCVQRTKEIIGDDKEKLSIELLDLQAKTEKEKNNNILIKNKRALDDFIKTTSQFLEDNFYCLAQKLYISFIIKNIANNLSISFENHLNNLIQNMINDNDIIENISKCFLKKFDDFEVKIKNFKINSPLKVCNDLPSLEISINAQENCPPPNYPNF
jgi:predicted GTPase